MMMKTFVCLAIQRKQREIMRKRRRNQERKHKRTFLIINASVLKGAAEGVGGGVGKMGKCSCQYEAIDMTRSLSLSQCLSIPLWSVIVLEKRLQSSVRANRLIKSADNFYICHKFCDSRKSIFCILFVYLKFLRELEKQQQQHKQQQQQQSEGKVGA